MFKFLIVCLYVLMPMAADAQTPKKSLPPGYEYISFTYATRVAEISQLEEIWRDEFEQIPAELKAKTDLFFYRMSRGNGASDVITILSSPYSCGVNCPLRIVTKDKGKYKVLLNTSSVFALDDNVYAVGPMNNGKNRNLLINSLDGISIWSYDDKNETYVRKEK